LRESKSQWRNYPAFLSPFKIVRNSRMFKSCMPLSAITSSNITKVR
jgi:hypothetical protein